MARYDPRYNYNLGYGVGNAALGLADLLGQGFDRYHKIGQDELAQQNVQQNYLLKLQEFLAQNENRGLDRQIKQQTADFQGKQIEDLIANRKAKADTAAAGQSAIAKFFSVPDQTTQEPAPQPPQQALAVSPQAQDRTLGQFIYGKRSPTPEERFTAMGPDAANLPDKFSEKLLAFYKDNKPLGYGMGPLGTYSKDTGEVKTTAPEKPGPVTPERTATLAASALDKQSRNEPLTPEEASALQTHNLKASTSTKVSAAQGENAARAGLQPAEAPRPTLPSVGPASGGLDRNPDFREAISVPVQRGSSVDLAAQRDLFGGQPARSPGPPGETILAQKTRLTDEAALGVKQRAPVGEGAVHYVLKSTGLPPPPDMPLAQVQKEGVAVTPTQFNSLSAARRGLTLLKGLEDPEMVNLFPENPIKAPGLLGTLANSARGAAFGPEAAIRARSDPKYGELVTRFNMAIPALAKATGEVGNLSEFEQQVVKNAMGIGRTRAAYQAGIQAYRQALERGFKVNGIPVPEELRSGAEAPTAATSRPGAADAYLKKWGYE